MNRSTIFLTMLPICSCANPSADSISPTRYWPDNATTEQMPMATESDRSAADAANPPYDANEGSDNSCPSDMVLVDGSYCTRLLQPCYEWVSGGVKRCARFGPSRCEGIREHKRFCIDRYEYPNIAGVKPVVMVSWVDARRACEIEDKRLCLSTEWTFACEGEQDLPYPYGFVRDASACNFEVRMPIPGPRFDVFKEPRKVGDEVARLDRRVESGSSKKCISPFGVHDMTGNVDEWVVNEDHFAIPNLPDDKRPYVSGLKGGYWGPIRAACRPITTAHGKLFRFYQIGFRCCANAKPS